ncbi:hypothetical protein [Rufibacter roseus]|uniref:Arginine deiminase n=1 Tax=Rufibacter roseus TaxID=1567108 RepID=A0ABW2DQI6_9BACT|nr:hypothetical protein [Rufibacter roseus]
MVPLPVKLRHYPLVDGLVNETSQDISSHGKQKKALAILLMEKLKNPAPQSPALVSSAHGPILQMLLLVPEYAIKDPEENPVWQRMRHLLSVLPQHTFFSLLSHQRSASCLKAEVEKLKLTHRCQVLEVEDIIDFTIWAQDPVAVVQDRASGETMIIEPHSFLRSGDAYMADILGSLLGFRQTQAPLYFEGGNILIADDFFFMGPDYPIESLLHIGDMIPLASGESPVAAVRRLYHQTLDQHRELIMLGSTAPVPEQNSRNFELDGAEWVEHFYLKNEEGSVQPLFHIDMFVSLTGRNADGQYQLLVGDPRLAAQLLDEEIHDHAMVSVFDNVARNLANAGFKVYRNPLPLTYVDDPEQKERKWYFATANNALVEIIDEEHKTVWLPAYGIGAWENLKITDQANKGVWESLGFKVHLLPDFHIFAENSGAVHCITKYLKRG